MASNKQAYDTEFSEQTILNRSYDRVTSVLGFESLGFDGTGNLQRENSKNLALKLTTVGNITYIAKATIGSLQSAAGLGIINSADLVSLLLQAYSSQSGNIFEVRNSSSALLISSNSTGRFAVIAGTGTSLSKVGGTIFDHFVDVGNTSTTETDLYTDTIPANTLSANGDKLTAVYAGTFVSSATATREVRIYFGGTAIFDTGALTLSLSASWNAEVIIIRVNTTTIRYGISFSTEGAALSSYTSTGQLTGLTLSSTNILKVTGQASGTGAATNDIVAKLGTVNWIPAA